MENDAFFKPSNPASSSRPRPSAPTPKPPPIKRKASAAKSSAADKHSRGPSKTKRPADKKPKQRDEHEEDLSEKEANSEDSGAEDEETAAESDEETPAQKRFRIAKQLLNEMEHAVREKEQDQNTVSKLVSHRLNEELNEGAGAVYRFVAEQLRDYEYDEATFTRMRRHKLAVTCIAVSTDARFIYSGSKDGSIIKWSAETHQRIVEFEGGLKDAEGYHEGHRDHVLALAISTDGTVLVSGGKEKIIFVWDAVHHVLTTTYKGHRNWISGLVFRKNTKMLFSASYDRTVKVWDIDAGGYIETLYGHQDAVLAIDALERERAVSCGGRDRSARMWKIPEESQLVFQGPVSSIDVIALIDESHFVTGTESGTLSLWDLGRKKSVCSIPDAHGPNHWILSLSALKLSDLVASGSNDDFIRLWKVSSSFRELVPVSRIPMAGFINSIAFFSDGSKVAVGIGQEPRLGRWATTKAAKNAVFIIPLPISS